MGESGLLYMFVVICEDMLIKCLLNNNKMYYIYNLFYMISQIHFILLFYINSREIKTQTKLFDKFKPHNFFLLLL